jgi:hypothetical protein
LQDEPDLIEAIQRDIATMGVVGEKNLALLIYLTGTSRLLRHPLRLIIRGPSAAGKSFPLGQVVKLFPESAVEQGTFWSPKALYRKEPGSLRHKLIVNGERSHRVDDEAADATAALRQLISEDRITQQVVIDNKTEFIQQEGPVAFVETTTAKTIFVEDLNRCLQVYPDETETQTKRILKAAAAEYLLDGERRETEGIIRRHQDFQNSLESVDVRIPFADQLAAKLPSDKLEARRAFKQLLAAIEAVAFLQQFQRNRDEQGRLVASLEDYDLARRLLIGPLNESLGCGDRAWRIYETLRAKFPKGQFDTAATVKAKCFTNRVTANTSLKLLAELGALRLVAKAQGPKPARWEWTLQTLKEVLPKREELEA